MGSGFLSFDEAAAKLRRSKRQVHNYVKQGVLTKHVVDGKVCVPATEVEQLIEELQSDAPPMTRRELIKLRFQLRRIEEELAVHRKIIGVGAEPLRPSPEGCVALINHALLARRETSWETEEMQTWATLFETIDEITLDLLVAATANPRPWTALYNLCLDMMKYVSTQPGYSTTLDLQLLHKNLTESKRKMREVIVVWVEMGRGTVPTGLFSELDGRKDALVRKFTSKSP